MKRYVMHLLCLLMVNVSFAAKPILIVVTNHPTIGETNQPTGYFLSEVAHPWHVFVEAGYKVEFASPLGGFAPMDPKSFDLEDPINKKFWHTLDAVQGLVHTQALDETDPERYAALYFAGGHGTMFDFPKSENVADAITAHYNSGGVIGAVCHGPAALVDVKIDGRPLVQGKRVAGFTNEEEAAVKLTEAMPFLLESRLRELGAEFVPGDKFAKNVVTDGRLITGQNPASSTKIAHRVSPKSVAASISSARCLNSRRFIRLTAFLKSQSPHIDSSYFGLLNSSLNFSRSSSAVTSPEIVSITS